MHTSRLFERPTLAGRPASPFSTGMVASGGCSRPLRMRCMLSTQNSCSTTKPPRASVAFQVAARAAAARARVASQVPCARAEADALVLADGLITAATLL